MNQRQKNFIKAMDGMGLCPEINYSTTTEKFYVTSKLEIKDGCVVSSPCEHRDSPEDAVDAYLLALYGKCLCADIGGIRKDVLILSGI